MDEAWKHPSLRAHWRSTSAPNGPLLQFDDDRASFAALWLAQKLKWVEEPPLLIRIDRHHDCKPMRSEAVAYWQGLGNDPDPRQVWDFVEWELDPIDGDWVTAAAFAGLIRGVVSFYVDFDARQECDNLPNNVGAQTFGQLSGLLGHQGTLMDEVKEENCKLWAEIGWDYEHGRFGSNDRAFVLSIDLDAFTMVQSDMPTVAWPRRWFESEFLEKHKRFNRTFTSGEILQEVIAGAAVVIVAREPDFWEEMLRRPGSLRCLMSFYSTER